MTRLKLAAAQIECRAGDIGANLARHLVMVDQARAAGVDLLVFPELSLCDYLLAPDLTGLGLGRDAPQLALLAMTAAPMAVSVGFIERAGDRRFHNAQALLANGGIAAIHRKLNLPGYGALRERGVYAKGETLTLAALQGGWKAATLICADSWNPALPWLAALAGANLLILPVASARNAVDGDFDNPRGWEVNLAHTALTYGLPTVFANHCGRRGDLDFWGGSRILDAAGRECARAGDGEELIIAEIGFADGVAARRRLPTVDDSDPALVQRLLAALVPAGA